MVRRLFMDTLYAMCSDELEVLKFCFHLFCAKIFFLYLQSEIKVTSTGIHRKIKLMIIFIIYRLQEKALRDKLITKPQFLFQF